MSSQTSGTNPKNETCNATKKSLERNIPLYELSVVPEEAVGHCDTKCQKHICRHQPWCHWERHFYELEY